MSDDQIFCAALELETEAKQRELVESLCANDSDQAHRVWGLLESHRKIIGSEKNCQSILDRSALVFQAFSEDCELLPGKQVGEYLLRELIGEGATSFVFRAQQLMPVNRDVALKILKPGMDSQRILARFGLEHQVIKRLEHPGITPVFDVGIQDNGRPFFAMELVPNPLTIIQYVEHFSLELRRCVELMIDTCEIVQHAHQRGVIHRDLKPSNILIEGVPQHVPKPRIIDFGIAKIMEPGDNSSSFTTLGERFGTPAYMSPEQALSSASSLDIRSDVYSLGVVLYELITGATPRNVASTATIDAPWTSESYWQYETIAPSRVQRLHAKPRVGLLSTKQLTAQSDEHSEKAPGGSVRELDLIVMKAIAKDRQNRYQTVADLQRDLQRFLNGEPIEAAGPGLLYRVRKMVNRNRAISLAAAVSLITIIATSFLTTSYAFRAHNAEQQVRLQLQETLDTQKELLVERDRAEEAMRQSQSLLRVFQVQSVTDRSLTRLLKQMLEAAQRGQIEGHFADGTAISIQAEALTKPHDRLIVRGDWQWASSHFPSEIVNTSFQLTSREAAQALPPSLDNAQKSEQPDDHPKLSHTTLEPTTNHTVEDRESLQLILLEELRMVLPNDDPFIGEVLDNCGLQALDKNKLAGAQQYLSESVRIWEKSKRYPENLVQSKLFLAEALMRNGQIRQSEAYLNEAHQSLNCIPQNSLELVSLREFHNRLRTMWNNKTSDQPPQTSIHESK